MKKIQIRVSFGHQIIAILLLFVLQTSLIGQDANAANNYFNQAVDYFQAKDFGKAIEYYSKAIQESPEFTSAYYNRANAKLNLKQYEEAIVDFDKTLSIDASFKKAHLYKGYALM